LAGIDVVNDAPERWHERSRIACPADDQILWRVEGENGRPDRKSDTKGEAGRDDHERCECPHPYIHHRCTADRQGARHETRERWCCDHRQDGADCTAGDGQDNTLGEQLPDETPLARSDRHAHGHLLSSHHGASQQQIRTIRTRDQQQAEGRAEQGHHQHA
jgi:hypothetical protein